MSDVTTTTDRAALVFGGSRGIGAAAVRRLAADGHAVTFTYATGADRAAEVAGSVRAEGGRAHAVRADSADAEAVRAAVAEAVERFGPLHTVLVNAGVLVSGTVDTVTLEDLDRALAVNVRGVFLSVQAAVPHLVRGARVVTVGSNVAVRTGAEGRSVYQMSKSALVGLVKGLALDLAPRGITVNNIQPGGTDTDMAAGSVEAQVAATPLRRIATPAEIAGLVAYLAGPDARHVTGESITIDGGFVL